MQDLWVRYLAAGGLCDIFDIEAHLQGVMPLSPGDQDTLAYALNERLDELYRAARVPYLTTVDETLATLAEVIADALAEDRAASEPSEAADQ